MAYLPKLKPTVGGGLGGLPERRAGGFLPVGVMSKGFEPLDNGEWLVADGSLVDVGLYPELSKNLGSFIKGPTQFLPSLPAVIAGAGMGVSWSKNTNFLAVGAQSSTELVVYKRTNDTFAKITVSLPPYHTYGTEFNPSDTLLVCAHNNSPYITRYSISGNTFTKLGNPSTLPTGHGHDVAFNADGTYCAIAHSTSPYFTVYKVSGTTFTKIANPTALPTAEGAGVVFSPDGKQLVVTSFNAISVYDIDYTTDTLTKVKGIGTVECGKPDFSPDGSILAVPTKYKTYLQLFNPNDNYSELPVLSDTSIGESGSYTNQVRFSPDGKYVTITLASSPYAKHFRINGDILVDQGLSFSGGYGIDYSTDGKYLAVGTISSPYISVVKRSIDDEEVTYLPIARYFIVKAK